MRKCILSKLVIKKWCSFRHIVLRFFNRERSFKPLNDIVFHGVIEVEDLVTSMMICSEIRQIGSSEKAMDLATFSSMYPSFNYGAVVRL